MGERNLDETDLAILSSLDRTGEIDADALSEELDVSPSTVYYRVEQYRERGIIEGTITELNPDELGFEFTAITEVTCDHDPGYEDVGERIAGLSGVQDVYLMLGELSFVVVSRVRDHDHLQRFVDEVVGTEGVADSSTHVVLREFKSESRLLVNYDDRDLQTVVDGD